MAPVARELSIIRGILEPLQTKDSVEGQILELQEQLAIHADKPVTLIGSSWGAVLALFTASRKEIDLRKLILIGSAVFDSKNSSRVEDIRMSRLNHEQRRRVEVIESQYSDTDDTSRIAEIWGELSFQTDVYDPITDDLEVIAVQDDVTEKVLREFMELRDRPGYLKNEFSKIEIPALVMHGDYDPHPIEGIRPFLEDCIDDIRFYILPKCGHYPWIERHTKDRFYEILEAEIG